MSFPIAKLAGSFFGAATLLSRSQTVAAEELPVESATAAQSRRKLPIYQAPTSPTPLVACTSPLQTEVGQLREAFETTVSGVKSHAQLGAQTWIGWEGDVGETLQRVIPSEEARGPGLLYVGVATLAGSILGRNRGIVTRLALPPTFLLLSLSYFLPQTSANLSVPAKEFEARHLPALAVARTKFVALAAKARGAVNSS